VDDFVHWRYSVKANNWKPWSDVDELEFMDEATDVFVEAWSQCGRVYQDEFKMVLHAHSISSRVKLSLVQALS